MSKRFNWANGVVVVAIVAILVTLLMPAIEQAKERRRMERWAASAETLREHARTAPPQRLLTSPEVQDEPQVVRVFFVQGPDGEWEIFLVFEVERRPNAKDFFARAPSSRAF